LAQVTMKIFESSNRLGLLFQICVVRTIPFASIEIFVGVNHITITKPMQREGRRIDATWKMQDRECAGWRNGRNSRSICIGHLSAGHTFGGSHAEDVWMQLTFHPSRGGPSWHQPRSSYQTRGLWGEVLA